VAYVVKELDLCLVHSTVASCLVRGKENLGFELRVYPHLGVYLDYDFED